MSLSSCSPNRALTVWRRGHLSSVPTTSPLASTGCPNHTHCQPACQFCVLLSSALVPDPVDRALAGTRRLSSEQYAADRPSERANQSDLAPDCPSESGAEVELTCTVVAKSKRPCASVAVI